MSIKFRAALSGAVVLVLAAGVSGAAMAKPDLAKAIADQNAKKVQKLLSEGADLEETDDTRRTPLFIAAQLGDLPLTQQLLDKGAKVDATDATGATPLLASLRNPATTLPLVQALLAKGADVNAADKTARTPLMEAVLRAPRIMDTDGQIAMVKALIAAGGDPARADASGATALHDAALVGEPRKVLEMLLAAAKDPNITTTSGANVLMMAVQNKQRLNADFLMARGFRPVRIKAVDSAAGPKPAIAQDLSPRTNAIAEDWYGQYATRKNDPETAKAAFAAAAVDYDAAAVEATRLVGAYEKALVEDKAKRNEARVGSALLSVGLSAITLGAGYYVIMSPNFYNIVEADQQAIKDFQAEALAMTARAAELRAKQAAS